MLASDEREDEKEEVMQPSLMRPHNLLATRSTSHHAAPRRHRTMSELSRYGSIFSFLPSFSAVDIIAA